MGRCFRGAIVCALAFLSRPAYADFSCNADPDFAVQEFTGEVYGQKGFVQSAGPVELKLEPHAYGWQIQVHKSGGGPDMAVITPPMRMIAANPRFISGWHFRNSDNSDPNTGDVNAPQSLRKFVFGTLATDPLQNPELIAPGKPMNTPSVEPNAGDYGVGEIIIEDYGLSDLGPGQKARMTYMKFSGCLGSVRGYQDITLADTADPGVPLRAIERMTVCGLNPETFALSDRMTKGREGGQNAFLTPDMDGDGRADFVTPIRRRNTQDHGLAICLAGSNRLILAGYNGRMGDHLDAEYFGEMDYWSAHTGPLSEGGAESKPPATPKGDGVLLGIESASSVILYLDKDLNVSSYWQGD